MRSTRDSVAAWARFNGCSATAEEQRTAPDIVFVSYEGCQGKADVQLYIVEGGGHSWPGAPAVEILGHTTQSINATELMWRFFAEHPRRQTRRFVMRSLHMIRERICLLYLDRLWLSKPSTTPLVWQRRANLKKSLLIALALLVLPFSLLISSGTANAAVETEKSLNARLLTDDELKAALASNNITLDFNGTADILDSDVGLPDMVASGRVWTTTDGSALINVLLSAQGRQRHSCRCARPSPQGRHGQGFPRGDLRKTVEYDR